MDRQKATSMLVLAGFFTIITIVVFLLILVMRKRIQLVIQLIREAGKAIAAMPIILFEPILVSLIADKSLYILGILAIQKDVTIFL